MKLKKKYKIIIGLIIFILILVLFNHRRNYSIEYSIDSISIKEQYNKKLKIHYIVATKNKKQYNFVVNNANKKKIVKHINYYNKDDITCLSIVTKKSTTVPSCYEDNKLIDVHLLNNSDINKYFNIKYNSDNLDKSIDNIKVNNYDKTTYLLWNYKGFNYLNENVSKNIKLLNDDVYSINIIYRLDNLVMLADYNDEYNFNKFIIIDMENGKKTEWDIDYDISMDSYILGHYNKSIYLVDRKNKVEYEIVPYRQKMRIVGNNNKDGIIYQDEFKSVSMNKLTSQEMTFSSLKAYNYTVEDDTLYLKLYNSDKKIQVSNQSDIKIVDQIDDNVYYLSKDKLYTFNISEGETLLIEYFEWNFNNTNMIFVYK